MSMLSYVNEVRRKHGLAHVLAHSVSHVYNSFVWPLLPEKRRIELGGVPVAGVQRARGHLADPELVERHRLFDSVVPWETPSNCDDPGYEHGTLSSLDSRVRPGDDVVIVGGGYGVSTVVAGNAAGEPGHVVTYEASEKRVELSRETVAINGLTERCDVEHAVVGPAVEVLGDAGNASEVDPSGLPPCDVLELDCEGAELDILHRIEISPRVIVVEVHDVFDAPEDAVRRELRNLGFTVVEREEEVAANGIFVLTAVQD